MNILATYWISIKYLLTTYQIPIDTVWYIHYICSIFAIIYQVLISIYIDIYRYCLISILYLSNMCPIFIITYRVPDMSMTYNRYFTTRYIYGLYEIFTIYLFDFLHKYYTYRVPDMYLIVSILTSVNCATWYNFFTTIWEVAVNPTGR